MILFLRAEYPDGPVDLDAHFRAMKAEIDAVPLAEQPDLVVSTAHASIFRHFAIGTHQEETRQFSAALLQDPETHQPIRVSTSEAPGSIVELGDPPLGVGQIEGIVVKNAAGTRQVIVSQPERFGDVTSHKTATSGGQVYVLDPGRSLLLALSSLEILVRLKRLNPNWGLKHYLGSEYTQTSVYPDDFISTVE